VKANFAGQILKYDFGGPPQSLVVPGELHFMEIEALIQFAGAPEELRRLAK
jgi:diphthine synthase